MFCIPDIIEKVIKQEVEKKRYAYCQKAVKWLLISQSESVEEYTRKETQEFSKMTGYKINMKIQQCHSVQ